MKLKKIICWFKGHSAYPEIKCENVPIVNNTTLIGGFSLNNSINSSMLNLGNVISNNAIKYHSSPFEAKFGICHRCHDVFWTTSIDKNALCNSSAFPELDELARWKKRSIWEENQRKKNEIAAILYKQYKVALKLGYNDDDSPI